MRIIDENEIAPVSRWKENHLLELEEVKEFVDSKAHMAELEKNPKYKNNILENYKRALRTVCPFGSAFDYKIRILKGKVYIEWLKWGGEQE